MAQLRARSKCKSITLFGGDKCWDEKEWTEQSDSLRGGASESFLEIDDGNARFYGTLDIETLGGAGFTSQRTTAEDAEWNLSDFAGIQLEISKGDKKRYTLNVKDDIPAADAANNREKSTISWECDFELPPQDKPDETFDKTVFIPWEAFNPTYRGKVQKDVDPLDTTSIKRFSIMVRSFFGTQEGDFSLTIESIKAVCEAPPPGNDLTIGNSNGRAPDLRQLEEGPSVAGKAERDRTFYSLTAELPYGVIGGNLKIRRSVAHGFVVAALLFATYHYFCRRTT